MKLGEMLVHDEHFLLFFSLILKPSFLHFLSFQMVVITQQPIIMSFEFFALLKVCTEVIKIDKHRQLKMK